MKKSIFFLTAICVFIFSLSSCKDKRANETSEESGDIGSVVYIKNPDQSGNLLANWTYSPDNNTAIVGSGYTTESPNSQNFEGDYKIYYSGNSVDSFFLSIVKESTSNSETYYRVTWTDIVDGNEEYFGTGIEWDDQLIVGWRKTL